MVGLLCGGCASVLVGVVGIGAIFLTLDMEGVH